MGALGIPSAADVERLTRRLRSVSQRLEAIEDSLDRLEERAGEAGDGNRASVDAKLEEMARDLAALREAVAPAAEPVPRAQERLTVTEPA
jgi:predicted  nucleic acid-binding Zn-ribbon protein